MQYEQDGDWFARDSSLPTERDQRGFQGCSDISSLTPMHDSSLPHHLKRTGQLRFLGKKIPGCVDDHAQHFGDILTTVVNLLRRRFL
jgi:hypothetical protein